MYEGDSFFTLTPLGQTGLAGVSMVLAVGMVWVTWALARRRRLIARLLIWAALFIGFLWLSPQIFYLYYLTIIDGLPLQIVVAAWPDPAVLGREIFPANRSLAADARLLLGIAMMATALAAGIDRQPRRSHQHRAQDKSGRTE